MLILFLLQNKCVFVFVSLIDNFNKWSRHKRIEECKKRQKRKRADDKRSFANFLIKLCRPELITNTMKKPILSEKEVDSALRPTVPLTQISTAHGRLCYVGIIWNDFSIVPIKIFSQIGENRCANINIELAYRFFSSTKQTQKAISIANF